MAPDLSFEELLSGLRRRDEGAASLVFDRFQHRLAGLARQRLHGNVRQKLDPEDVVQSVLGLFFQQVGDGYFVLRDWRGLWNLLACITARRCGRWNEHFHTRKCDVNREVSPEDRPIPARDATASAMLLHQEAAEQLLSKLPEKHRPIVQLSLDGLTVAEISQRLQCGECTVRRILQQVRQRLKRRAG
jgi:RNA polymerase sigma factor (sigma-70 family)